MTATERIANWDRIVEEVALRVFDEADLAELKVAIKIAAAAARFVEVQAGEDRVKLKEFRGLYTAVNGGG